MEDLQRNPSSRQIIPLQGRLGAGEFVSGSITVEVRLLICLLLVLQLLVFLLLPILIRSLQSIRLS